MNYELELVKVKSYDIFSILRFFIFLLWLSPKLSFKEVITIYDIIIVVKTVLLVLIVWDFNLFKASECRQDNLAEMHCELWHVYKTRFMIFFHVQIFLNFFIRAEIKNVEVSSTNYINIIVKTVLLKRIKIFWDLSLLQTSEYRRDNLAVMHYELWHV